ncbi:MAG TPA: UvrD-helicase domain-containing protein [Cyclobacteriaceae bacterium]
MSKAFTIYRSSAGSGKTRTLAKEYIKLALRWQPEYYRHILAVTFANKATQEMKERILLYLDQFARGEKNNLSEEVKLELGITDAQLKEKSSDVLSSLLHHYSQFSISTIDSFFQRVIRSFTREAGLLGNFRLEVDNDLVMDEVIGELMDELGPGNKQLTDWVIQFSRDRLTEGENWNITYALKSFSQEIFKEQFKEVEEQILKPDENGQVFQNILNTLSKEVGVFENFMKGHAQRALDSLSRNGLSAEDFNYKDQGTAFKYFQEFARGKYFSADGSRIQSAALSSLDWPAKKGFNYQKLKDLAERELIAILKEMIDYDAKYYERYKSAIEVLKNFYAFGLISDITRKLKAYKQENNLMLLSDAPQFLNGIINNSDTPFIYEKVGSFFKNYLIDEFQDTSSFQWQNFLPLLKEAGDQGQKSLIVGDVKQSIYRWRGGDLSLLQTDVAAKFGSDQIEVLPLNTNYRSAGKVVEFNNNLFNKAATLVQQLTEQPLPTEVFGDVEQKISRFPDRGYVHVKFLEKEEGDDDWQEQALRELPFWIEQLQDKGASLKDIAILVRTNKEGQRIANYLLQFRSSADAKPDYKYEVVSNESLRLDTSRSVSLLINAMMYLNNRNDAIARGQLAFEIARDGDLAKIFAAAGKNNLAEIFPPEFLLNYHHFKRLSLFELTEELIRIFKLGETDEELAYLQAFQDLILEFSARDKTDLTSFLEWWELYKDKKSIQVSASVDAINIITIHKAKGLQYKFVLVPFCNWKLNHEINPLMWVESDKQPFQSLGHLAVRYSGSLEKTYFKEDFEKEFTKAHLDNLNVLYVAFTRAEEGLIVFAPKPYAEKLTTTGDLLFKVLQQVEGFNREEYTSGTLELLHPTNNENDFNTFVLDRYPSYDWRNKLVIKREGTEYFESDLSEKRTKINRGILVHTVLSRIHYKNQMEDALRDFFLSHALPEEDQKAVEEQVAQILQHKQAGAWFAKEWEVKTESTILLPGQMQQRIDRIMFSPKRTVIIDYKTGERKEKDRRQMEGYASVLAQMGYPNVEAYLLYLKEMVVEEVVSKSNLSLF